MWNMRMKSDTKKHFLLIFQDTHSCDLQVFICCWCRLISIEHTTALNFSTLKFWHPKRFQKFKMSFNNLAFGSRASRVVKRSDILEKLHKSLLYLEKIISKEEGFLRKMKNAFSVHNCLTRYLTKYNETAQFVIRKGLIDRWSQVLVPGMEVSHRMQRRLSVESYKAAKNYMNNVP